MNKIAPEKELYDSNSINSSSEYNIDKSEVITFGCRLNIYESEIIKKNLAASKLKNVAVFNTCAVTKEAEKQAKQNIRKYKRDNPSAKIIVTGCAAQNQPDLFSAMPEVDKIIGNEEKLHAKYYELDDSRIIVNDIMNVKETANHLIESFEGKTRAFLQVQNGCDHRCTFCMIPFGRGNSRSVPIGVIMQHVKLLVSQGFKEVVLTGVDVTAYGPDLPGKPTFAQMIRRLFLQVPELKRLRLSSIDVAEIDEDLFDIMAHDERLMPHFHISLQAGDDLILKRMKRRHLRKDIIEFCTNLRKIRPEVSFGADIIAGFPTEDEKMFENTRALIASAQLQYLHVFPYSEREGTPATRMPQVIKSVRKERAQILREEGEKQRQIFFEKHIGLELEVLSEQNNIVRTNNFIPAIISNQIIQPGEIYKARLIDIDQTNKTRMIAEII